MENVERRVCQAVNKKQNENLRRHVKLRSESNLEN